VTTPAQLRKAALALPETTEGKHFGSAAFFSVRGRGFASLTKDGIVQLKVSPGDVDRSLRTGGRETGHQPVSLFFPLTLWSLSPGPRLIGRPHDALVSVR
jgi:hypothetical protein